jgi:hypothetical protein
MHNIGAHAVCTLSIGRAQRKFVGACTILVCSVCMLNIHMPCKGLINGARGVLVHGVSALNLGIVWHGECNVHEILACDTKIVQ